MTDTTGNSQEITGSQSASIRKSAEYSTAMLECFDGYLYICSDDFHIQFNSSRCKLFAGGDKTGELCYESIYKMKKPCPWCKYIDVLSGETSLTEIVNPVDRKWYRLVQSRIIHSDNAISIINCASDIDLYMKSNNENGTHGAATRVSIDLMADAVVIFDLNSKIIDINEKAAALSGLSVNELRGRNIIELFSENELDSKPPRFDLLRQGNIVRNERNILCKDGKSRVIESSSVMMPDGYFQSIIRDVTERKKVEESLLYSEEKIENVFKISPDAITVSRLNDGVFIDVNNGFLNMAGYRDSEVLGRTAFIVDFAVWVDLCDRERLVTLLEEKGGLTEFEAALRRKDGSVFYGMISARIIDFKDERCLITIIRDMTEKKRQEDILRQSEKKYREMANTIPLGIFEADLTGRITFANLKAFEWFGYTQSDFDNGLNIRDTVVPEQRMDAIENVKSILMGRKPCPNEYFSIRKDGSKFPTLFMSNAISDSNGKVIGLRGSILDMTERKKIEDALQNTQKLESVGVLAGGIAHDFNNLLAGIFSYLDLGYEFLNQKEIDSAKDCVEKAMSVFERAKSLTQQLLTFSKGGTPIKKTISLENVLKEMVQFSLSGSCVMPEYKIQENLWYCDADIHQIEQVVDNIVINARQAMPDGGKITVSAGNVEHNKVTPDILPEGRYILISFTDTGCGIPEEIIPRIFDPFFTTKKQGSGLGLATTYSIVKKHGGYIFAESESGKGTVFSIYLPAVTATVIKEIVCEETGAIVDGFRILVMDDEAFIRDICRIAMKELNCNIIAVSNAGEAMNSFLGARIAGLPFDLVILDLTIPGGLGGLQVLEQMRNVDPDICAIASSGYSDDPVMSDPQKYGFTAKLAKPYLKSNIQAIVKKYLTAKKNPDRKKVLPDMIIKKQSDVSIV